jgi:integrase
MGRPPLDVGTYGKITTKLQPDGQWMAIANYRDGDGITRPVKRFAETDAKAIRRLKKALVDRNHRAGGELTRESTFAEVSVLWLKYVDRTWRGTTWDRYRSRLNKVLPAMGQLKLRECTTQRIDAVLEELEQRLAPNTVRGYRATISGVLSHAVRLGAIDRNPCQQAAPIRGKGKESRALTREEREDLLAKVDADPRAIADDLPAIFRYLMGTGTRIGELMALRWCRVDLERGIVVHADTLVSETKRCKTCGRVRLEHKAGPCIWNDPGVGAGLVLHSAKTEAGIRTIRLPSFVQLMLELRHPGPGYEADPVFGNAFGGWRNPSNTGRSIRLFREKAGYGWFSAHTWRRTAITVCDEEGITARETSGYVGHSRVSMTESYMDRRIQSGAIPAALDAAARPRRS